MPNYYVEGPRPVTRTALQLLQKIDRAGGEALFVNAPAGRWRMDGTSYVVNDRTFWPLSGHGLLDVGNGPGDPVKITDAGREYLRTRKPPTPATAVRSGADDEKEA